MLGGILHTLVGILPAPTMKARFTLLWQRIQAYYREVGARSRLGSIVPGMVKRPKEPAKLRCKAGECRGLVQFGWQQANLAQGSAGSAIGSALCSSEGGSRPEPCQSDLMVQLCVLVWVAAGQSHASLS